MEYGCQHHTIGVYSSHHRLFLQHIKSFLTSQQKFRMDL
ncbi:hypothetical protein DA2_0649 [Desulfovibrio sp. A2]|nr:hypothetical protein DA2_0649 [Desulfovibrio sp. A2]